MATMYRQQLSQAPEPAMASPAALQQAAAAQAKTYETLAGFAGTMFKGYMEGQLDKVQVESEQATQQFLISNQAASAAQQSLAGVEQQKSIFEKISEGPRQTQAEETQFQQQLKSFNNEIDRLKLASEGGMSNEQYLDRVNTITRQAIAKYPGLADEIRRKVSLSTGLEGAEQWAAKQFVKERFSATKAPKEKTESPPLF